MYNDDFTTNFAVGLLGIIGIFILIVLAICVFFIVCKWKIFKKCGEEGWKSIIPYYSTWTLCNVTGLNPNWVFVLIGCSVASMIPVLAFVAALATIYFQVLLNVSLAKSFGKDTGYGIGLMFVPIIFYPMLAFGKDQYVGKNPMQDMIFKNNNPTNNQPQQGQNNSPTNIQNPTEQNVNMANNQQSSTTKYCTDCGAQIPGDSQFCTNCGSKTN